MEVILGRFGNALESAVDDVHRVAQASYERARHDLENGTSNSVNAGQAGVNHTAVAKEQLSAFTSRIDDLKESLEYSERLYERTAPSLRQMLDAAKVKRDQNAWLLAAVCREHNYSFNRRPPRASLAGEDFIPPTSASYLSSTRKMPSSASLESSTTNLSGGASLSSSSYSAGSPPSNIVAQTPMVSVSRSSRRKSEFIQSELKAPPSTYSRSHHTGGYKHHTPPISHAKPIPEVPESAFRPGYANVGVTLTPVQASLKKRGSTMSLSSNDSDPRTPTLEDFGLSERFQDFDAPVSYVESPVREQPTPSDRFTSSPSSLLSEERKGVTADGPADCFLLEEDLDALPSYVQTQVDVPTLNKVLDLASNHDQITTGDVEKVAAASGATGSGKALILALLELGRLKCTRKDTYRLAESSTSA
mmetsp:Transcript_9795/g.19247  ORF Transcript_9795/g.19247 Transcript_9795/m.19247 type:complete len:419 (+) Transcript_9795:142-1398(+)